ncbi:MAG: hypothetical protein QGG40_14860 [Myxococcota bacterium]|jgi:hypothetical protein|nr:hypothetical protein [Myxococcota bacterium]
MKRPAVSHSLFLSLLLGLGVGVTGCSSDKDEPTPGGDGEDTSSDTGSPDTADPPDTGEPPDTGAPPDTGDVETADSIGDPIGDATAIDHETAAGTVEDNLVRHIDGLDEALSFLEDSDTVINIVDMLFGDDDDDDDEGEDGEEEEEEPFEIDLSELRDGVVEIMADRIMVEQTAVVADDGLSIRYSVSADFFCPEEPDEYESEEDEAERLEDEAECAERLAGNPLSIDVMSDGEGDMNLSLKVGEDEVEALAVQIHDDMMALVTELPNLTPFFEIFVDPDDFALPETMEGTLGVEIREDAALVYTARFAVPEGVDLVPDSDQEPYALHVSSSNDPGGITIDGDAQTLSGALSVADLQASVPWQMVVDMFYDDEGEWETNDEGEEEWVEPTEAPEVEGAFHVSVPAVDGSLDFAASDDAFVFTGMSLGESTTTMMVDSDTILSVDLNPDDGRSLDLTIRGNSEDDLAFVFSPLLDGQATFAWQPVSSAFEDLPSFMLDETLGVLLDGSDEPTLEILRDEDDTRFRVTSGTLTLWSSGMDEDVVIEEGECITSVDEETLTEEEKEAQHDLFGGLLGETCEE